MAFDKFKGVATSREVAMAARAAILETVPEATVVAIPCADGGEGTLAALSTPADRIITEDVTGPLSGMRVKAQYALHRHTAIVELASASGLALMPDGRRDVMHATTLGTGMLLMHAISQGARHLVMGIGGSASNDCGMGLLSALGFRFLDKDGRELAPCGASLPDVARVDSSRVDKAVLTAQFDVITDVDNPLCGPQGAAAVYAPQKGASAQQVQLLDEGARHFSALMPNGVADVPGAGAAGGVGAGMLAFLNTTLYPGADAILRFLKVEDAIKGADLVMTGEGRIDASTSHGKLPYAVARLCARHHVPVVALCGALDGDAPSAFASVQCINPLPVDMPTALRPDVCLARVTAATKEIIGNIINDKN